MMKKLNSRFYVMKRCSGKLNYESKQLFVKSLVFPYFNYCASTLYLMSDSQISLLQKIMNRYMRLILRADFRTPRQSMIDKLGWLTVKQQISFNTTIFMDRIANRSCPFYLASQMIKRKELSARDMRSSEDFLAHPFIKDVSQNSLWYKGIHMFNDFKKFCNRQIH